MAKAKARARTVRGLVRGVVFFAALFMCVQDAGAQALIVPGDTIRVALYDGGEVSGVLESVLPGMFVVNDTATIGVDTVALNDVRALSVRRDASYGGNAFKGGVMGVSVAVLGIVTAFSVGCGGDGYDSCNLGTVLYSLAAIPIMAVVGAAIGARTGEDRKWVRADVIWLNAQ